MEELNNKAIGQRIRQARQEKHITQGKNAAQVEIFLNTVKALADKIDDL